MDSGQQNAEQSAACTDGRRATLSVHVVPRASKNEIVGVQAEGLKVRVTAPPVKGKANKALVRLLAETLRVKEDQIEIVSGREARRKTVRVEGLDQCVALDRLLHSREKQRTSGDQR